MRPTVMTRTLLAATAVLGLTAGGLATAGSAVATPPAARTTVTADVSAQAVNNLGLSTARAKNWQCWVDGQGFNPGPWDGKLGSKSWKAAQKMFNRDNPQGYKAGTADGIVGKKTIKALQRYLNDLGYNAGATDGVAGQKTKAAFREFNATC
ncbi:peptidoglycan-binding domain-containing protein [Streptomyces sp. WG-D5]